MKQRHRKHRRPVRDIGWYACAVRYKPISNVILLAPDKWAELMEPVEVDGAVNLLRGEIGTIDCGFRILPLLPVDPKAKPA